MTPSRFSCRCLVFLLLVAAGAGLLARPAEAAKRPFDDIVNSAARRHGVDPGLVHAVIAVESGYRATAQSPAGAQGLMQLMPGTQRQLGVSDAFDPQQNVDAGAAYLRRLTDEFGTVIALAAYNAGPGAVRRYNGIPPYKETRAYVQAVLDRGRSAADAQALAEHDASGDRAHAAAEADVAEGDPGDRRLQDDHLAVDGAAGREPHALDRDDRAWVAVPPDPLVNPRGAQAGALRQDVADERPIHRSTALDRTHPAADTARLVLHHDADRLTADAGMRREGPGLPVLAANAGVGSRRAAWDCSPSLLLQGTPGSHVGIRPLRTARLVADRRRPRRGSTTARTRDLRIVAARARETPNSRSRSRRVSSERSSSSSCPMASGIASSQRGLAGIPAGPVPGCLREGSKSYAKVKHVRRWRRGCSTPVQVARTFSPCSRNCPCGPTYL